MDYFFVTLALLAAVLAIMDWNQRERKRDEYEKDMDRYSKVPDEYEID